MRATATTLEDHRVKLLVEIDESELESAMDRTARAIANQVSIKGFRKGKAPRRVIEARLGGAAALRAEALRDALGDYYARAISETLVEPIGQPNVEVVAGEDEGPLTFEANVMVRPDAVVIGYEGLKVTLASPEVSEEEIEDRINRLRETDAELRAVDRPAQMGDAVQIDARATDLAGTEEVENVEDYSIVLGSSMLAQGVDEIIVDHSVGDTVEAVGRLGEGGYARYEIKIKAIFERILPELTDEWVAENSEYATVDELRQALRDQLSRVRLSQVRFSQRDAVLGALADLVEAEELPEALVTDELESRMQELRERLTERGISYDYYLQVTQQTPEDLYDTLRADADRAVKVDLGLRAIVRLEGLEPSEEDVAEEIKKTASSLRVDPEVLREQLYTHGRLSSFTSEVGKFKASKWLFDHVTYVDEAGVEIDRTLFDPVTVESAPTEVDGE